MRQIRIERISSGLQPDALPFELPTHNLVDNVGLEPTTFCVQNRRSPSELIAHILVLDVGIEPTTCWLQVSCSSQSELIQHIGVPSGTWTHTVSRQFLRLVRLPFRHKHINKFGIPSWTRTKTNGFGDRRANQLQLRIYNNIGVPNRIWTYDQWIKSPMLYPAELWVHIKPSK